MGELFIVIPPAPPAKPTLVTVPDVVVTVCVVTPDTLPKASVVMTGNEEAVPYVPAVPVGGIDTLYVPAVVIGDVAPDIVKPPPFASPTLVTVPFPLLLNVFQSVEERYPLVDVVDCVMPIVPVVVMGPPVIGAVVAILVTVPEDDPESNFIQEVAS